MSAGRPGGDRAPASGPELRVVGNDVVDLTAPRVRGRATDRRFVARVLAPEEAEGVRAAADPDLELWHAWAAKEAAYKVVSKLLDAPPVFVHRAFRVRWDDATGRAPHGHDREAPGGSTDTRRGRVTWEGHEVRVRAGLRRDGSALEVVALPDGYEGVHPRSAVEPLDRPGAPWCGPLEELRRALGDRELDAVHSRTSAAVRIGARMAAADELGVAAARLEIVCRPGPLGRRPPTLFLDGAPAPLDVSLSHDGPWIAWALLARPAAAPSDSAIPDPASPSSRRPAR